MGGAVGLPPSPNLYVTGDEIVRGGDRRGGSGIRYSSKGWGNSFLSRGGEQASPPPSLNVAGDEVVREGGKVVLPPSLCKGRGTIGIWALDISNFGRINRNAVHVDIFFIFFFFF